VVEQYSSNSSLIEAKPNSIAPIVKIVNARPDVGKVSNTAKPVLTSFGPNGTRTPALIK
jgi:hypothetical protein